MFIYLYLYIPKYVKKLKKEPIEIKYVKVWNDDSVKKMKACLETTDWNVLNGSENVSENADVIASYIKFCEEESFETKKSEDLPQLQAIYQ